MTKTGFIISYAAITTYYAPAKVVNETPQQFVAVYPNGMRVRFWSKSNREVGGDRRWVKSLPTGKHLKLSAAAKGHTSWPENWKI